MPELIVTCECGFEIRRDEGTVIAETQQHARDVHNMDVTREQVLAMAKPAA